MAAAVGSGGIPGRPGMPGRDAKPSGRGSLGTEPPRDRRKFLYSSSWLTPCTPWTAAMSRMYCSLTWGGRVGCLFLS